MHVEMAAILDFWQPSRILDSIIWALYSFIDVRLTLDTTKKTNIFVV